MDLELCRKFFAQLQNYRLFVGFSGGADSTAALIAALYFQKQYNYTVTAIHFDHHLRGMESDADAVWCKNFAESRGIAFKKIDLHFESSSGIEEAARLERLKWWKILTAGNEKSAVILGHHSDDRIENFMLRLLRGSNLAGLLSPKAVTHIDSVEIIRPLLYFSRAKIENFLLKNKISDWRIDSTNTQSDCSRNNLRIEILPRLFALFPGAYSGAAACLEVLEQDADFIERSAEKLFDKSRCSCRSYWQKMHPALAARIIRMWKQEIPTRDFLQRFQEELQRPVPQEARRISWNNTCNLVFQNDEVFWESSQPDLQSAEWDLKKYREIQWGAWTFWIETADAKLTSSKYEAVFDADDLGTNLIISLPSPGEKMQVFGSGRMEKIKKLRVDAGIPAYFYLPVVKNSVGDIIWAPGIRHSALCQAAGKRNIKLLARSTQFGVGIGID